MVIGVTGGIASGKSVVCKYLSKNGFVHIDADQVAHDVLEMPDLTEEIVSVFGSGVLAEDGEKRVIDRKKLGAVVFADAGKMAVLESMTHPRIIQSIHDTITADPERNYVIEAIAFIKSGLVKECDELWVVHAEPEQQISRLMNSRGLTLQEALDRLESQKNHDWDEKTADHVIFSTEPVETMENQVRKILENMI